jgi:hypothetical protein
MRGTTEASQTSRHLVRNSSGISIAKKCNHIYLTVIDKRADAQAYRACAAVQHQGGRLPEPEANGKRYLKFPLDALEGAKWG